MSQEKYGGGLLLRNFRKNKPNQPDFTGNELDFCCPKCQAQMKVAIAAWEKTGGGGKKFFSLAISAPYVRPVENQAPQSEAPQAPQSSETGEPRNPDSDIPF
jgi:hypothetical protein